MGFPSGERQHEMRRSIKRRGINTIELVLAITLFGILVAGGAAFQVKCLSCLRAVRSRAYARQVALNVAEELAASGYEGLAPCDDETFEYPRLKSVLAGDAACTYTVCEFDPARPGLKRLRVRVLWNRGRAHPSMEEVETLLASKVAVTGEEANQ